MKTWFSLDFLTTRIWLATRGLHHLQKTSHGGSYCVTRSKFWRRHFKNCTKSLQQGQQYSDPHYCFRLNLMRHLFLFERQIIERSVKYLPPAGSLPQMAVMGRAKPIQNQEPGVFLGLSDDLSHPPLHFQARIREMDWKWSSGDLQQSLYGMLTP